MSGGKSRFFSPTRNLAALSFVLTAMWYAASSQNNAAAYLLFFALTSAFVVSLPRTFLNLGGLHATVEAIKPAFAGNDVEVPVEIDNRARAARFGVSICLPDRPDSDEQLDQIRAEQAARATLRFVAPQRGEYRVARLRLATVYPFGFVRATKEVKADQSFVVYPKPAGDPQLPIDRTAQLPDHPQPQLGEGDDFAGVRAYVPGESQRHIDWKAVARGQELMTKQFTTEAGGTFYVDLADAGAGDLEDRLSQLALWVLEAERMRRPYGLRLNELEIAPSLGEMHFHRCLRALALFQ